MARDQERHARKEAARKGQAGACASSVTMPKAAAPPLDPHHTAAFYEFLKALAREAARADDAQER
jgi:hypothetical protein